MNREEFYIYIAPVFATYLSHMSSTEALRRTAAEVEDLDRRYSRELLMASLTPNPASVLSSDRLAVVRQYGFAVSQEEAGVPRGVLVHLTITADNISIPLALAAVRMLDALVQFVTSADPPLGVSVPLVHPSSAASVPLAPPAGVSPLPLRPGVRGRRSSCGRRAL